MAAKPKMPPNTAIKVIMFPSPFFSFVRRAASPRFSQGIGAGRSGGGAFYPSAGLRRCAALGVPQSVARRISRKASA